MVLNALTVSGDHLIAATHVGSDNAESGHIALSNYANKAHRSWSVGNAENCEAEYDNFVTEITFSKFETERHHDQLSVYEGPKGFGPLVSVLHGSYPAGKTIKVQGPCAHLVFISDHQANDFAGFEADWQVLPVS